MSSWSGAMEARREAQDVVSSAVWLEAELTLMK